MSVPEVEQIVGLTSDPLTAFVTHLERVFKRYVLFSEQILQSVGNFAVFRPRSRSRPGGRLRLAFAFSNGNKKALRRR